MTYSFVAGNVLTAAQLNALAPVCKFKQSTQTSTTTTIASDTELTVTLTAGKTYLITLRAICGVTAAGDIKMQWLRTGTLNHVGSRMCTGPSINTTDVSGTAAAATTVGVLRRSGGHSLTTAVNYGLDGTSTAAVEETFAIQVDVTGDLTLQWAQNAASGSSTVVAGSYLIAEVIAA
jgi:hypothetical protein